MKKENPFTMPYVGCLVGMAFQRMMSQLDIALKKEHLNITAAEYMILRALYSRDGLQQCEITDMVGKDKSSVCRSVSALAKKGFVSTENVSYKCIRVWLTEKGNEIRPTIMQIAGKRHQALLSLAPESDIESFVKVLKAIAES